jgi:hypothetical protein
LNSFGSGYAREVSFLQRSFLQKLAWLELAVARRARKSGHDAILALIEDVAENLPAFPSLVQRTVGRTCDPRGGAFDPSDQAIGIAAARELGDRVGAGGTVDSGGIGLAPAGLRTTYQSLVQDTPAV